MKYFIMLLMATAIIVIGAGCSSTSTVYEYDASGTLTRKVETKESIAKSITDSAKNKTLIVWRKGWAGYMSVSMATEEDPTPTGKLYVGKIGGGYISILPDHADKINWPAVIAATGEDLSATLDGFTSSSTAGSTAGSTAK